MEKLMEWQIADDMAGYANQFFSSLHAEEQVPQQAEDMNADSNLFSRLLDTNSAGVSGEPENGGAAGHDDELFTDQPGAGEDLPTML